MSVRLCANHVPARWPVVIHFSIVETSKDGRKSLTGSNAPIQAHPPLPIGRTTRMRNGRMMRYYSDGSLRHDAALNVNLTSASGR